MKPKTIHSLIVCLMLTVSYLPPVHAVTDAELEALEKQIEQLETDEKKEAEAAEKKKAEAAAKRIKDQKRKANAEAEKKRLSELEKQRIEEEERLLEETRLAEQERQRQKEEAKKQKIQEQTIEILASGCSEIVGIWHWKSGAKSWFFENGTVKTKAFIITSEGTWECVDSENRIFTFNTWDKKREIKMSDDSNQIESVDATFGMKIIANKVSDDPFEKNVPSKDSSSNVPGL